MKYLEFESRILKDGKLEVPLNILEKLKKRIQQPLKVILVLEDKKEYNIQNILSEYIEKSKTFNFGLKPDAEYAEELVKIHKEMQPLQEKANLLIGIEYE
ncbi:MAG: hypothetical protein ACE5KT_11140 [Methanosarcinales archaeon]